MTDMYSQQSTTVVERRAADVAVIGGGLAAVLSAFTLARAGRKVLLLSDYGLAAARPQGSALQPLKLTDTDPLLVHLAAESSAYWRGLELLSSSQLLSPQASCDVVLQPDRDHAGAEGFSKLQDACAAAGVTTGPLSCSEAMAQFRQLRLPHSSACLLQPDGAVLHAGDAASAARTLAEKAGVVSRPGLILRGWRDRGSCFQLRASSRLAPELLSLFEAEALLLAPEHWAGPCLGLFGLAVEGLQPREVLHCQVDGGMWQQQAQLPLWQYWGEAAPADQPVQPIGMAGLPLVTGQTGGWVLQQLPAWGLPVADPFTWQPASQQWQSSNDDDQEQQAAAAASSSASWVEVQVRQLHQTCSQLVHDVGPLQGATLRSSIRSVTQDGRPIIGQHPGFEPGRVVVAAAASGAQQYGPGSCSSSFQMSPMLAKLAGDVVRSAGGDAALLQGLELQREGLGAAAVDVRDPWEGLQELQAAQAVAKEEAERAADEASDSRQDLAFREPVA
ncbi:hypothetical protein OEZ85_011982 [Tetradesmus obliquus]|uniref:FAD dependent oxidoreductase domain-containing protein n=1 Tax=Tetradesmus obliquus TaxID=3088 RepID=A0ABY8TWR0_TETOB|nr:hypothetical protein OEZ85_011982 [Tetradesmus obliquus]